MIQVPQGRDITLLAQFADALGSPLTPDIVTVDIFDPDNTLMVDSGVPVAINQSQYSFTYSVPPMAPIGTWRIQWTATYQGSPQFGTEDFTVVASGVSTDLDSVIGRVRLRVGERIPVGGTEADTRLTDQEVMDSYYSNSMDETKAIADLWLAKAGMWAELVDIAESGAVRALSQLAKAAERQYDKWYARVTAYDAMWEASNRVVGVAFSPYARERTACHIMWTPEYNRG